MIASSAISTTNLLLSFLSFAITIAEAQAQTSANATEQSSSSSSTTATATDCIRFYKTGFWDIDIDNKPALPPHCQPPFSRNADRNTDHLPYQIAAIAGSYIACVIGIGLALLSVRRRRRSLLAGADLSGSMVELKLVHNNESKKFEPAPIASPARSATSWMRNPLRSNNNSSSKKTASAAVGEVHITSPGMESIASFDSNVIDAEKDKRQAEMDRLYAAVMLHDAARRSQMSQAQRSEADAISQMPRSPHYRPLHERRPSDRNIQRVVQQDAGWPNTAASQGVSQSNKLPFRAIYPPSYDNSNNAPLSPTSPAHATVPDDFWPQRGRQPLQIQSKRERQPEFVTGPLSPQMPLSPTTPRIELPNDMYPASPPPGGRRMRLPNHVGQAFPLSPGGPITPISAAPMTAALQINSMSSMMDAGPASPRYQLSNDMYPASPPLQSHPMTFAPPPVYTEEPIRRPSPARSFGSRMETESIISNKSNRSRKMKPMRINTGASLDKNAEDRAPLSATFRKDLDDSNRETSDSATPDTPRATDFVDQRIETMNNAMPSIPQTRLGTPPRRPAHRMHSRGPSGASISSNFAPVPSSPALSHMSNRSIGLPSGPKSGVLPGAFTSHPRPSAIKLPPQNLAASPVPSSTRSPPPANAPGGSKPLALRVQFGDDNSLLSPAPVKTTFLERRTAALRTGAKTPGTGMPQTPYSAYMPFTPVTPVTPHLVTRQERKQRKREMGKSVLQDADMVREEDEEW